MLGTLTATGSWTSGLDAREKDVEVMSWMVKKAGSWEGEKVGYIFE